MTKSQVGHEICQTGEMQSKVFVRILCDSPSYPPRVLRLAILGTNFISLFLLLQIHKSVGYLMEPEWLPPFLSTLSQKWWILAGSWCVEKAEEIQTIPALPNSPVNISRIASMWLQPFPMFNVKKMALWHDIGLNHALRRVVKAIDTKAI